MNKKKYSEIWTDLNRRLKHIERTAGGLAAALEALSDQQRDQGFIQDDLPLVRRYRFAHPEDPTRSFVAQYNAVRALRFEGAGGSIPDHFHFQFFKRRASDASFPLEVAARKSGIKTHGTIDDYPIAVMYWRGDLEEVVESALGWIRDWIVRNGHRVSSISAKRGYSLKSTDPKI